MTDLRRNTLTTQSHRGRSYMPVESAEHKFTMMAFPSLASADSVQHLEAMQSEIVNIANTIARFEQVHLFTRQENIPLASSLVGSNVLVKPAPADQLWIRDSGPIITKNVDNGSAAAVNFSFNYWGSKIPSSGDEQLAQAIADCEKVASVKSHLRLEGGAIEIDGDGTFLGTESSIINDNRNPGVTKEEAEAELHALLGVTKFIWVPGVKNYDITDYHIDALARFVQPSVVLLSKPHPKSSATVLQVFTETRTILSQSEDAKGRSLTIHECEEPDPAGLGSAADDNEIVASYANYYLVNRAVVIPRFGQASTDDKALELFKKLFPSREVVQVPINILPRTGGGIHCATQQWPQW